MVVLPAGQQVRCILWVQGAIYNKGIGFLCGLKFFALNILIIFCGEYLIIKSMFEVAIMLKRWTVKDVPINNYELKKYTGLFIPCFGTGAVLPISSGKLHVLSSSPNTH